MLLPGPEAQQLAVYVGWLLHGTAGGLVAGVLFVLPGALVMLALSIVYVLFQDLVAVEALFFGIKAAVLAVVDRSGAAHRPQRALVNNQTMITIAVHRFRGDLFLSTVPFPGDRRSPPALIGYDGRARVAPAHFRRRIGSWRGGGRRRCHRCRSVRCGSAWPIPDRRQPAPSAC